MAMYDNLLANVPTDLWIGGKWRKASDGARFDARSATTMLLWSSRLDAAGAQPVGAFTVRWDSPEPGQTTIGQVAWAPSCGGTEAQVWRAVRVLAGVRWPFANRRPVAARRRSQERRAA